MTTRSDVTIDYNQSPRVVEVAAPSDEFVMQDVVDTLRKIEDTFRGMSEEKLLNAAGKEDLGGGVLVGLTVALQDALIAFEGRTTPAQTGAVTTASGSPSGNPRRYSLIDTSATFQTNNVNRGSLVINFTDQSIGEIYRVVSETECEVKTLQNGTDNDFDVSDAYQIYNITQVRATGGNLVAVDNAGDPLGSGVLPTWGTQVLVTSSSSATLQELTEIRYSAYQNAAHYDENSSFSGTDYPNGTPLQPVNNWADAVTICEALGFDEIHVIGNATLTTGDTVEGYLIKGLDPDLSLITLDADAVITDCRFTECTITGTLDGETQIRTSRVLPPLNFISGSLFECLIEAGTISLSGSDDVNILNCWSGVAGLATPSIDYGGSGRDLIMRNYSGGIEIKNKTGSDDVSIDLTSGQVKLDSTVTAGTFRIAGTGRLVDNSTGTTINDEGLLSRHGISHEVWNELTSEHTIAGSFGEMVGKKLLSVKKFIGLK